MYNYFTDLTLNFTESPNAALTQSKRRLGAGNSGVEGDFASPAEHDINV